MRGDVVVPFAAQETAATRRRLARYNPHVAAGVGAAGAGGRDDPDRGVPRVFDLTVPWIPEVPTETVACLLCSGRETRPLNTFVLNGHRFFTVRCRLDGMMWLDPRPTPAFYERLYREYYHRAGPDDPLLEQATLDVHTDDGRLARTARWRVDELEALTSPGRLLEVGFGAGHTLAEAQRRGWTVFGIEASPAAVAAAGLKGVAAACGPFLDFPRPAIPFDVVAMYSVIEHVPAPGAYLGHAHALLRLGGLLVLRLPDTPVAGPPASLLAHVHHFNRATITELLRRAGFRVVWIGALSLWKPTRYPGALPNMTLAAQRGSPSCAVVSGERC